MDAPTRPHPAHPRSRHSIRRLSDVASISGVPVKRTALILPAATVAFLMIPALTFAHHGSASYDMTKPVSIKGTVTDFEFTNPHSGIHLDVEDGQGDVEKWFVETDSPNNLARFGWNRNSLKPGDQVTIIGNPAKDGSKILRLQKVVFPDGRELKPRAGDEY
jgi:hypothetical protein